MVHLTNTLRSATFLLGTAMLTLCLFCAPMHAQTPTFKSTSSYRIANSDYSAQQLDPTTIGHQAYRSTIYTPFGSSTPSSNNNPGGNNDSGSGTDDDDEIGIPGYADTPGEPLPIGDGTLFLLLIAAMMITIIAIKQRKQKQLQSITTNNNNNPTQHMTTRKQTYKSFFQKLFLLLAFVCIAGQMSAEKKTIYFRPSTVGIDNGYAGSWGLTSATTANNVSWAKRSSEARFLVLERKSDETYAEYSEYKLAANILPKATSLTTNYSRFIPTELDATSSFAIYRIQSGHSTLAWDQGQAKEHKYNCIPNNEWWKGQIDPKSIEGRANMLFSMSDLEDCNMVAIREGYWATGRDDDWKGYYFGYYLEEDAHIYFDNKNGWTAPTFLRSKDIYAYTHDLTQISGTNLWYCKLAKPTKNDKGRDDPESGIAYTQYAFIGDRTTKTTDTTTFKTDIAEGLEDPYLWKRFPHNTDDDTDLARTKRNKHNFGSLRNGKNYTETITKDKLSGKTNLYIPGAEDGAKVDKQTLSSWQDLNHTHTVTVEEGGMLNYRTIWLTGASSSSEPKTGANKTETITFQAAYTASVTLRAIPKDGYVFLGFYDAEKNEMLSRGVEEEYDIYPITHKYTYDAPNSAQKIIAKFVKGNSTRYFKVRTMIYDGENLVNSLEGGTFTMTHSGGITYTHAKIGYHEMYVSDAPMTFEATPNSSYEFIGWFNVKKEKRYPDNRWIIDNPMDTEKYENGITAVFASSNYAKKQNINIEGSGTVEASYIFYHDGTSKTITFEQSSSFVAWTGKQVTLTATPLAGYKFDGWYKGEAKISSEATYDYNADDANTITAKFVSEVNKLTVSVLNYDTKYNEFREYEYEYNTVTLTAGGETISSYSSLTKQFEDATEVTLTATPESDEETGYDFIGWYQNNTLLSDQLTINVNVIGLQAISAHFAPKKCWKLTLVPNSGGTYTVHYGKDKNTYPNNFYSVESSLTDTVITYAPYSYFYTVSSAKPILGYKFQHHDASPLSTNENYWEDFGTFHNNAQEKSHNVVVSFVRDEDQVVYLDLNGQWERNNYDNYWVYAYDTTNILGVNDGKGNVRPGTYKWILMTEITANSLYTCTIPRNTYSHIKFVQLDTSDEPTNPISSYSGQDLNHTNFFTIPATRYNCMKLQWSWNSSTNKSENAWTTPPTQEGDFQLVYIEQTVLDKNTIHEDYRFDKAEAIKKRASTGKDTVSLHIYNKVSDGINGVNNPEVILQRYDGTEWVDIERYMVFGPLRSNNTGVIKMPHRKNTTGEKISVDQGIGNIIAAAATDDDQACGVWNFVIQQTIDNGNVTAKLLVNETHRYTGNYYIRTTNADGQYNNYTHPGNVMKLSEYAAANSDYSHYFIRYVDINEDGTATAEPGKHPVIKFAIANDYAIYLNHELMINNDRFTSGICKDDYEDDPFVVNKGGAPNLPADASVRFGWDSVTNRLTRAYIANTIIKNNEYLVVEGENIGDATYFTDNSNWLYSIDLPDATAGAAAKVKAKMNGQYQYFMGSESENETLISGNGASTYPIRLLYDFKDDRFTTIYRPNASLSGTVNLETPVMIEREHNYAPTQIQFNSQAKFDADDNFDQPAYAVMTFLEEKLASKDITHHEKMFYWISFPFDVRIKDVFGLGDYGKYWIMEEYNGEQRAKSGLAQNNWKYITKKSHILKKDTGYVLCLNYSQILQDQLFKSYGGSDKTLNSGKLSLYFPSNSVISPAAITGGQTRTVELAQYENANTAWNHHNWHIIGVPSFANPTLTDVQTDAPFVYQYWHPGDAYDAKAYNEITFYAMHAYMVQYYGDIIWTSVVNTGTPLSIAAKKDADADKKVMLRLELQQAGSTLDKTYVQLRNDKGTKGFDMSLDLTKIINAGANIYSIVDNHEMAGNAIPKEETVLPLGVVITAAGEYTFAMPNGTEGMIIELIDYEQGTSTNLLMSDYTITLNKGTFNQRFALRLKPDKVATSVDNIGNGANGDEVRKLFIDGVLYLQKGNNTYDAQGKHVQ